MKIISSFEELKNIKENIVAALGTFDGLHRGHLDVLDNMLISAKNRSAKSMVITFDRHPKEIVDPARAPYMLLTQEARLERFKELEIDYIFMIKGTKEFFNIEPNLFVDSLLDSNITELFVGENFTFGKYAKGTAEILKAIAKEKDVYVNIVKLAYIDEEQLMPVSSTLIRRAIKDGNIELANRLLGYNYGFTGIVVKGDQRGRTLGFPTANFILDKKLACPKDGVYVNRVCVDGIWYNGVGNVGDNPTFKNQQHRIEIHIFDFDKDIYGSKVKVEFLKFIRAEVKFSNLEGLITQMAKDKKIAHDYLKTHNYEK